MTIVDDLPDEPLELIDLTLSNPSAATLGTQSTATIEIADDDIVVNPIPTLSQWGLLLAAAGLALMAALRMTR